MIIDVHITLPVVMVLMAMFVIFRRS